MPTYKFEKGDKVFFFKNELSDFAEINTTSVGRIVALQDNLDSPYCYRTQFAVNRITEEEDGRITETNVSVSHNFNEHQLGFIDSTLYSEDFKFERNYYREYQMVRVSNDALLTDSNETNVGLITKISRNGQAGNQVWIRTAAGQKALDLDKMIEHNEILPFLFKDHFDAHESCLKSDLMKISYRLHTHESGSNDLCVVCNEWTWEDNYSVVPGHGVMCERCWENYSIECSGCENIYALRNINHHWHEGNDYCQSCYDMKIFKCTNCRENFEDIPPFMYDNHRYCEKCYGARAIDLMSSPPRMLSRSSISRLKLPPEKNYIRNKSKTAVAIEIEAITNGYDDMEEAVYRLPNGWNDTYDGSISNGMGREFIMSPEVGDAALNKVKKFCRWLNKEEWYVDKSCGIHVHTDAFYSGVSELKGILITARALEPLIYNMLPDSRMESRYSKPMESIDSSIILEIESTSDLCQLWYEIMNNTHASADKYNDSRYRGFNLHSRFLHGTIEYRYHHGTVNDYYINNWILFCLAISDFGATLFSNDKSTVDLFTNVNVNDIRVLKDYDYLSLLEAMGISNLIPYIEEMIDRSASTPNEINGEAANWSSAQSM